MKDTLDVVYVVYNSEKWIEPCFQSWMEIDFDLSLVNIIIVDNGSTDQSAVKLREWEKRAGNCFASFTIIEETCNWGFGRANNIGCAQGSSDIVCFFNIDTQLYTDTMIKLMEDIHASGRDTVLWELRQFPYEHPKLYDVLTHETGWSSGAAFAVRRDIYEQAGGFDEEIFLYAEDVDLSWRIRSFGYHLKYVPDAVICHHAYDSAGTVKPAQHVNSVINNLLLRYRFGGVGCILAGHMLFWKCMAAPEAFSGSKKQLLEAYLEHFKKIRHFMHKKERGNAPGFCASFLGFDYSVAREGAFYVNKFPKEEPLISILVRTCQRPSVLRETLWSLRQQTYKNIEVIVVEDGRPSADQMIREEFSDMNIIYKATAKKLGRSAAGNLAMSMAQGRYLNFLDDDDLFFADHVEVLVYTLLDTGARAAYAYAFQTPITVKSREPYKYKLGGYEQVYRQKFDKILLCHHNYIPIQCMMFERSLFEQYGGLDESLDALEDWDLWVRYSLHTDFICVEKTTSIYRVPMDKKADKSRQELLDQALLCVRDKHKGYIQQVSVYDLAMMHRAKSVFSAVRQKCRRLFKRHRE